TCVACAAARADYNFLTAQLGTLSFPTTALLPSLPLSEENHTNHREETEEPTHVALVGKRPLAKRRGSLAGRTFGWAAVALLSLLVVASTLLAPFVHFQPGSSGHPPTHPHPIVSFDPQH